MVDIPFQIKINYITNPAIIEYIYYRTLSLIIISKCILGREVKAIDLRSIGHSAREFEPRRMQNFLENKNNKINKYV